MLPATARLRRRDDFSATVAGGRRSSRGSVVVHLASNIRPTVTVGELSAAASMDDETFGTLTNPAYRPEVSGRRAGFVVSKAIGGAVVRNRVRRRLRELMRSRLSRLPDGTDVVVRALPSAVKRTYAGLGADLDVALDAALQAPARAGRPRRNRGRSR